MTHATTYRPGTQVRFSNAAGACLAATVTRVNRSTYTLDFYGREIRKPIFSVHEACSLCGAQ